MAKMAFNFPSTLGITSTNTPYQPYQPYLTTTGTWDLSKSFVYTEYINSLNTLSYNIDFQINDGNILNDNISGIRKNKIIFYCKIENNRILPYEYIMKLIDEKSCFTVKVKVSDILTISYTNFRFTKIQNNLNFRNSTCSFGTLDVTFKYDKIIYENHKLSTKQLRMDKIKKITENK